MGHASTQITTHSGDKFSCCEWPDKVMSERDHAIEEDRMMKLEAPTTPAGQMFYLDPRQITSIEQDPYR